MTTSWTAATQVAGQEAERLRAQVTALEQELATAREARPQPRHVGHPLNSIQLNIERLAQHLKTFQWRIY